MLSVLTRSVSVRTITVTDAAYSSLARLKRAGESFSDVLLRITRPRSLGDLPRLLSPTEARAFAEAFHALREEHVTGRRRA